MKCLILSACTIFHAASSGAQAGDIAPKFTYEQSNCRYRSSVDPRNRVGHTYITASGRSSDLDREHCLNSQRLMILMGITSKNSTTHSTEFADEGSVEFRQPGGTEIVRCKYTVPQDQEISGSLFLYLNNLLPLPTGDVYQFQKLVTPIEDEMKAIVDIECVIS